MRRVLLALLVAIALALPAMAAAPELRVGSKKFTESVILGEIAVRLAVDAGARATHRRELGGTRILWQALKAGEIDLYVEYSGTLVQEILGGRVAADDAALAAALAAEGIGMTRPLGFNNTYAIAVMPATAERLGARAISDLIRHPALRIRFSEEFLNRADGWPALRARYGLPQADVRGLDHDLAYRGLAAGDIDAIDVYTTDAEIAYYGLRVLADDRGHFPHYGALVVYRLDLRDRAPGVVSALDRLAGRIDETTMARLNAKAKIERVAEARIAADFVAASFRIRAEITEQELVRRLWERTLEHLGLVAVSLAAAIIVAIPLGILAARLARLGQAILAVVGVVQTVPSLALLVFMIPVFGIGAGPAIVALFLYSLLPIVRNTHAGITDVPGPLAESAQAMGLSPRARLRLVELPIASRAILAGIKTSAVINVGTATLGALIGAGGYGQPILTGIRLDDTALILEGAVPAALLALIVQGAFDAAERRLVPRGLRLAAER